MIYTHFEKRKLICKSEEFATVAAMTTGINTMLQTAATPLNPNTFNGTIIHFDTGFNPTTNMYYYTILYVKIQE